MHAAPESAPPDQVLHSTLHTFMRTGHMRLPFQPQHAAPALALSMPDELRIRDRSTILARHLYSEQGTAFADQQVRCHPTISSLTSGPTGWKIRQRGSEQATGSAEWA